MHEKPELTSSTHAPSPAFAPGAANASPPARPRASGPVPPRLPRWLERSELFLRVLLRMYIGLAVCYIPWSGTFWDQNPLFARFPLLGAFAASGAVRGMVSGLGLLNLWIAFQDALHHWDE
ncbi:MAG: hypothetical protein ACP5FH_07190 [Terracidiphilus sp.]